MIYLITGVPGSGKTLYAVSTLLRKLAAERVKLDDGAEVQRRLVVDNIPRLIVPHELMASGALKGGQVEPAEGHGLWNWHEWCKPGDVIVSDEVQRHWRPRGMGTKPPEAIAMLETHRHKGVDLVLITQNPMLLDQNVRRLVGRHLHVRRLFGGARALIYEWDGCNTDTSRLSSGQKSLWSYPKSAYKLYASSELHTKQHQKVPLFLAFPLVVAALGVFAGPKAYEAMHRSMTGHALQRSAAHASATPAPVEGSARGAAAAASAAAPPAAVVSVGLGSFTKAVPGHALGCIAFKGRCECFDEAGDRMEVEPGVCEEGTHRVGYLVPARTDAAKPHDKPLGGVPDQPSPQAGGEPVRSAPDRGQPGQTVRGAGAGAPKKATAS